MKPETECDISGKIVDGRWNLICDCGWTVTTESDDPDECDPIMQAHFDSHEDIT